MTRHDYTPLEQRKLEDSIMVLIAVIAHERGRLTRAELETTLQYYAAPGTSPATLLATIDDQVALAADELFIPLARREEAPSAEAQA